MIGKALLTLLLLAVLSLTWLPEALAGSNDLRLFNSKYDTSGTRLDTCKVCHTTGTDLNPYGMDMSDQTGTIEERLTNIEQFDSDEDGFSNIDEMNNLAFPGDPSDIPSPAIASETPGWMISLAALLLITLSLIITYISSQMKELDLRKWHRNTGIVLAPLLVLQAVSGVLLGADWLLGYHRRIGEAIREIPPLVLLWDKILVEIHYGLGVPGAVEHILLGIGLVWITVSGVMIFLRIRARKKRLRSERHT